MPQDGEVRLTYGVARVVAPPHRPDLARKGYKRTLVLPSWHDALDYAYERLEEAAENGRAINTLTITDLEIANRNYDRHQQVALKKGATE